MLAVATEYVFKTYIISHFPLNTQFIEIIKPENWGCRGWGDETIVPMVWNNSGWLSDLSVCLATTR